MAEGIRAEWVGWRGQCTQMYIPGPHRHAITCAYEAGHDGPHSWEDRSAKPDPINHPAHYMLGRIEVIDAIEEWGLGFHRGQVVKYVARAGRKELDKEVEDLEKGLWYLSREIERLKKLKEAK